MLDKAIEVGLRRTGPHGTRLRELKRRLRAAGVQALLANYGPTGIALLPLCSELKIPLLVHFHGYDAHLAELIEEHKDAYRRLGRSAWAMIVVSRVMARALESYGVPQEKIHLVRCGADATRFPEKTVFPDVPIFFGVGRFVDKKAPYLTVLAFKRVHDQYPQARLILGGDGVLLEATQNLALCLGLGSSVEFPGVLKSSEVTWWMQGATAFVQHSIVPKVGPSKGDSEGTPVAVLEAMLAGLPVVSTRHAGIGEVIEHGRTGLLVEERDVDGMALAMLELARKPSIARSMGRAAREEALKKYTADCYIQSLERILASVP